MMPRSLFTTRVASASPSTSSAMMRTSFLPVWSAFSSAGSMSWTDEIFLSVMRMYGSSRAASIRPGSVTKYAER